ncbi:LPP20 family lipoprotein [Alkalilimnicola ehrlichii]|uniref:LPP20 family lipoprotein n=1 Tax=Alkalilimnicola ehrlichii TaxID=351052 RepID=UPI0015F27925|nr:LPP20 family lipoprotein [Alkalilimnicola ehrlichii]
MVIIVIVIQYGCARHAGPAAPGWVYGTAEDYPAERYLTGRGEADTAAQARDRARADLAKTFEVRIEEQSLDRSSRQETGDGLVIQSQEVARELQTRIDRVVRGVEIAAQWRDPQSGRHHALAVLSRARAVHGLRDEIAALDEATEAYISQAQAQTDLFAQLRAAAHSIAAQRQREELQRNLRVLDATGQGVPPRWSLARLEADYDELLLRVSVRPESSGDYARDMREGLSAALAHAGFTVTSAAQYTVFARLDIEDLSPRDGWHWRNGVLEVSLRDEYGHSVGSRRWVLKEAATDPALADRRIIEAAVATLVDELGAAIFSFTE